MIEKRKRRELRHAPHARIALDNLAEIVRSHVSDDRFGLGNQGFPTFPAERSLDGGNPVIAFRFGGEHSLGRASKARADASN
jgi:hypothetical protein